MKILIADDHTIVRKGLISILLTEFPSAAITEVSDGESALIEAQNQDFDFILLDISMPEKNGMETLKCLRSQNVKSPVLILSIQPEEQYAVRSIKLGAAGFMNKDCALDELIIAVHKIINKQKYISASVAEQLAYSLDNNNKGKIGLELLSGREMQVLEYIAAGKTISQIAELTCLSSNTISTYRMRILEKLELKNNAELTRYAMDYGLV